MYSNSLTRQRSMPAMSNQLSNRYSNWGGGYNQKELISRWLPMLYREAIQHGTDPKELGKRYARNNTLTVERGGLDGLEVRYLSDAYIYFLQAIQEKPSDSGVKEFANMQLDSSLREDKMGYGGAAKNGRIALGSKWLKSFRAFAAVSCQTKSTPIARILYEFIAGNYGELLASYHHQVLAICCLAIKDACMAQDEKRECLTLLGEGGDVIEALAELPIAGARLLAARMEKLQDENGLLPGSSLMASRGARGRGLGRYNNRQRYRSPSTSDDDFYDSYGSRRSYGRGLRRSRSVPATRRIVRQADRLMDAAEHMHSQAERLRDVVLRG